MIRVLSLCFALIISSSSIAQIPTLFSNDSIHIQWADSVLATLTFEEQIAQLLMPPVYAKEGKEGWEEVETWVEQYKLGGVIAMQGSPTLYQERVQRLQSRSQVPLLISTDAEWGLGMRLKSTRNWPRAMTLGATNDSSLIRRFGQVVGSELHAMGFHVNFAPVVDVNSNPQNPVIGSRSFGSDVELVGKLGTAYALGLQDVGVLATAKHFPGHGDTNTDSHLALPTVPHAMDRLDSVELAPFRKLISNGVGAMMAAHLFVPALDDTPNLPSTLSAQIIDSLLRKEMGFDGLVFTDAMNMKGFTSFSKTNSPHVDALIAGNDILLFPNDPGTVIKEVLQAAVEQKLDSALITAKCRRVLMAKSWCEVWKDPFGDFDSNEAEQLHQDLLSSSLTIIKNEGLILPFDNSVRSFACLYAGFSSNETDSNQKLFEKILGPAFSVASKSMSSESFADSGFEAAQSLLTEKPNALVLHVGGTSHSASKGHGITDNEIQEIERITAKAHELDTPVILVVYGSPYLIDRMSHCIALSSATLIAYQDDLRTLNSVAHAITGAGPAKGKLPVATAHYPVGFGLPYSGKTRLGFSAVPCPNQAVIDSIIQASIDGGALPGCRMIIAKDGLVVCDGMYGTLDGKDPVKENSIYDLASITKIAASTLSLMHLEEQGLIDINEPLAAFLPELEGTDFGNRKLKDILSHRAGLKAWIPFYVDAMEDSTAFSPFPTAIHSQRIHDELYMRPEWKDSIWNKIIEAPLNPVGTHRYSDLGYYAMQRILEEITQMPLDEFVRQTFYEPNGWESIGYNPLDRFNKSMIAPTEKDNSFRMTTVRGDVHDQGAAMMNGVAGHAGLFSNVYDLARLMYMLRLGGFYGGQAFLEPPTIKKWVTRVDPDENHRKACGFDRPTNQQGTGPTCDEVSYGSFGHSGFTGTLAWADPDHDIIFIFLSNRTYPDAENRKLIEWDVRTKIQHQVYSGYGIGSRFEGEME